MTLPARRALISVWDKTGLADLGRGLVDLGIEILSTGGTRRFLEEHGVKVTLVADVTDFPEILGGRVKTLHPAIHGGILAHRAKSSHLAELQEHGIEPIDLVVVNLYPFREAAADPDRKAVDVVEMIDIGGPCMVRAAAKNHHSVAVVVDPGDYPQVLAGLESDEGQLPEPMRLRLALKAFRHTQSYDASIARWFEARLGAAQQDFPNTWGSTSNAFSCPDMAKTPISPPLPIARWEAPVSWADSNSFRARSSRTTTCSMPTPPGDWQAASPSPPS